MVHLGRLRQIFCFSRIDFGIHRIRGVFSARSHIRWSGVVFYYLGTNKTVCAGVAHTAMRNHAKVRNMCHCAKRLLHPRLRRPLSVRTFVRDLRRVQAFRTRSYPPRQLFRNLSTVYFSNPHKQRLANDGSIFWDPFLDPLFEQKSENFTKKYPNILVQKMIKMVKECASRHLPCRV